MKKGRKQIRPNRHDVVVQATTKRIKLLEVITVVLYMICNEKSKKCVSYAIITTGAKECSTLFLRLKGG
ncbi:hypothetical protein [Ligilactobacillus salivarius]|uniref:hypothetical protein n=1 Tax=Ligilactobacillus salivarius TaxID=1624 RepID=UPI000A343561|nr:hypothetical protein [Ligilactobacillus salivarius]